MSDIQYDLCPKCGAVSQEGVCTTCGYRTPGYRSANEVSSQTPVSAPTTPPFVNPARQTAQNGAPYYVSQPETPRNYYYPTHQNESHTGMMVTGIIVLCLVIFLNSFILLTCYLGAKDGIKNAEYEVKNAAATESSTDLFMQEYRPDAEVADADYLKGLEGRYTAYDSLYDYMISNRDLLEHPSHNAVEEDPYDGPSDYYEIEDYIDTSVDYTLEWAGAFYDNSDRLYDSDTDSFPTLFYGDFYYPIISDTGLPNEEDLNQAIYETALRSVELFENLKNFVVMNNESYHIMTEGFVTYMDNDVLSILFDSKGYIVNDYGTEDEGSYRIGLQLYSVNIDLKTGSVIRGNERFKLDGDFYKDFKKHCEEQNGNPVRLSDDELIQMFKNDEEIWVFTPLGVEIGCNDSSFAGWSTATFTDVKALENVY